jgi:hypothetical protein
MGRHMHQALRTGTCTFDAPTQLADAIALPPADRRALQLELGLLRGAHHNDVSQQFLF